MVCRLAGELGHPPHIGKIGIFGLSVAGEKRKYRHWHIEKTVKAKSTASPLPVALCYTKNTLFGQPRIETISWLSWSRYAAKSAATRPTNSRYEIVRQHIK
jgi:hypothetical protein